MKKSFCVLGIIVSLVVSLFGVLLLSGALTDSPSSASSASYLYDSGYAIFGADFYTYVSNNAAEAASATRTVASNQRDIFVLIRTASGIFVTGFGLLGFCLFGAFLGLKQPEQNITVHVPAPEQNPNVVIESKKTEEPETVTKNGSEVKDMPKNPNPQTPEKIVEQVEEKKDPLWNTLEYAAKYTTDDGMKAYLNRAKKELSEEDRAKLDELLKQPDTIRSEIQKMLNA